MNRKDAHQPVANTKQPVTRPDPSAQGGFVPEGARIFLAHAGEDKKLVRKLYAQLKKRGLQPWLDEEDLLPGQNWTTEIPKAIRECEFFIACLSKNSIRKQGYVQKEFRMALDVYAQKPSGTIYLIPLKFDDCEVPAIELPQLGIDLRHIQWLDYWKSDGLSRLLSVIGQTQMQESDDPSPEPEQTAPPINDSAEPTQSKTTKKSYSTHQPMPGWVPVVSVASALVFIVFLLMLAVFIPEPTDFQMFIFRIVLALASAAFGATIPGFFKIKLPLPAKGLLYAGGALALFALIYLVNPPMLIPHPDPQPESGTKSSGKNEEFLTNTQTSPIIPQKPVKTLLSVTSSVSDAKVYLDDRYLGSTDLSEVEITPGRHQVRVEKQGYLPDTKEIEIKKGGRELFSATLELQPPAKGTLSVRTKPENATIKILNIAPKFYQGIELASGNYHLEISANEYDTHEEWVSLLAGEDKEVMIRLERSGPEPRFTNSLGMEFVYIKPGSFTMGSPKSEEGRYDDEIEHQVKLTQGFYLQTTEVTVGQFRKFAKATGYRSDAEKNTGEKKGCWALIEEGDTRKWDWKAGAYWDAPGFNQTDLMPVACVSWNDAQAFIKWVSDQEEGHSYTLPTEAQWEYAARAGSTTAHFWGNDPDKACTYANVADKTKDGTWSWNNVHECSDGYFYAAPVGSFKPNGFGLYDMIGNVWEWCQDWYGAYPSGRVTDPQGPSSGAYRVLRGGGWGSNARNCRSANRDGPDPGGRYDDYGFRLAAPLVSR